MRTNLDNLTLFDGTGAAPDPDMTVVVTDRRIESRVFRVGLLMDTAVPER